MDDHELAASVAAEAAQLLLRLRTGDPGGLRDRADRTSHELIAARLASARADDALLSEEGRDDPRRTGAGRVWIVDPLDGTREYGEPGRQDWTVHVALAVDGAVVAAAVAQPAAGLVLRTPRVDPPPPARGGPLRLAVSRTRPAPFLPALAGRLGAELVPMGSAGAKTLAVISGEVDAYVHAGGQYEWDSAAPVGVAMAAGLHASRLDGSPLRYGRADPRLPDLVVCRPELAERLLGAIGELREPRR